MNLLILYFHAIEKFNHMGLGHDHLIYTICCHNAYYNWLLFIFSTSQQAPESCTTFWEWRLEVPGVGEQERPDTQCQTISNLRT